MGRLVSLSLYLSPHTTPPHLRWLCLCLQFQCNAQTKKNMGVQGCRGPHIGSRWVIVSCIHAFAKAYTAACKRVRVLLRPASWTSLPAHRPTLIFPAMSCHPRRIRRRVRRLPRCPKARRCRGVCCTLMALFLPCISTLTVSSIDLLTPSFYLSNFPLKLIHMQVKRERGPTMKARAANEGDKAAAVEDIGAEGGEERADSEGDIVDSEIQELLAEVSSTSSST